jgi:glucose/arabinose dehydrogenase
MRTILLTLSAALAACSPVANATDSASLPFDSKAVATLDEPWAMTFLPGSGVEMTNVMLVSEKKGRLQLIDTKSGKMVPVTGVPQPAYGGQGGFGDVVADPGFAGNRLIWMSWVETGDGGKGAVVGKARLDLSNLAAPKLEPVEIIWRQTPKVSGNGHFGHRIAFGPDGMVYISSGERQKFDPAQDMTANLGKIVRIKPDGSIPADNPFAEKGGVTAQIWSLGHRNPMGLAFDVSGQLWNAEMGPAGGDELNLVRKGGNYGYPKASNGSHYDGRDIPDHKAGDGFNGPVQFWNPSISPGGLLIYTGTAFPQWRGDAFIAALGGEALIHVDLDEDKAVRSEAWPMGARIRDVEQGPDGAIWLVKDGSSSRLLKLTPKK